MLVYVEEKSGWRRYRAEERSRVTRIWSRIGFGSSVLAKSSAGVFTAKLDLEGTRLMPDTQQLCCAGG